MRYITFIVFLLLSVATCQASGWNDFTLNIGGGYSIFRANSMDVSIGKNNGSLILFPRDYDNVGPVVRYAVTPKYIFTKNAGTKPRNLFEGDTFQDIDYSQEYYFILIKGVDKVIGPLSKEKFSSHQEVGNPQKIGWKKPKKPNILRPILGSLLFLAISIPILAIKFYWVSVPILIGTIFLVRKRKKT